VLIRAAIYRGSERHHDSNKHRFTKAGGLLSSCFAAGRFDQLNAFFSAGQSDRFALKTLPCVYFFTDFALYLEFRTDD
jgi:hypothetical protein